MTAGQFQDPAAQYPETMMAGPGSEPGGPGGAGTPPYQQWQGPGGQPPAWGAQGGPDPTAGWAGQGAAPPAGGGWGGQGSAPAPGGWPSSGAPPGGAQGWPNQGATAPIGAAPGGWQAAQGGTPPTGTAPGWGGGGMPGGPYRPPKPPRSGGRGPLIAILSGLGVLVLYFAIIAPVASIFPFAKAAPSPSPTPPGTSPAPAQPTPALASGVASLAQLLPSDIDQPDTECQPMKAPYHWDNPGLVQALSCNDPGLSGGTIYAYQMDSAADFQAAFKNFNKWWGFDFTAAGTNCPPAAGHQGTVGWNDRFFPQRTNQSLECSMVGSGSGAGPAYAYAYPTDDAFILAQAAPGTTFKALDTWWTNNAGPAVSPTPATQ
jgi:hypothetical protein